MPIFNKNKQSRNLSALPRRAPITTYYKSSSKDKTSSPFVKKTPKKSYRKLWLGFLDSVLIIILIFLAGYSLLINTNPVVNASDSSFHKLTDYQAAVVTEFKHLKNRDKITFNENDIASSLKKQYPEINNISIELPVFSEQAKVNILIAKPAFIINSQGQNYLVNTDGMAVSVIKNISAKSNLIVIQDQTGFNIRPGNKVMSNNSVEFIQTVISQCQRQKVAITTITLPPIPQEMDLRVKDQPYYIKFFLNGDAVTQAGQFLAARDQFIKTGQTPSQYLDVRVTGKVFYK